MPGREDARPAVDVADLDVLEPLADPAARLEDRELVRRRVAAGVLEEVDAVVGLVGAVDDEVEVAVAVEVHRQRPGPEADAEVDDQAGIVVLQPLEPPRRAGPRHQCEAEQRQCVPLNVPRPFLTGESFCAPPAS